MAERLDTPVDIYTGLPAVFLPPDNLPPPPRPGQQNLDRRADWNHHFPKFEVRSNSNLVISGLGELALLNSRKQWVDFIQHHEIYNYEYNGPRQPETEDELFRTSVFALAGYIPEEAIDLSKPESMRSAKVDEQTRRKLWETGQVRVVDQHSVRNYLFWHVLQQDANHLQLEKVQELLSGNTSYETKIYLAHAIAAKVVERAVEPIAPIYEDLRRRHLLHPGAEKKARDFVKPRLIVGHRSGRMVDAMIKKAGAHNRAIQAAQAA